MQCEVQGSKEIAPTILNLTTLRSVALIIFTKSLSYVDSILKMTEEGSSKTLITVYHTWYHIPKT